MEIKKSKAQSNVGSVKRKRRSQAERDRRQKRMVALWYRGSQFFGSLWESQYGSVKDDTIGAWMEYLFCMTEEQLATGIELLSEWGEKFPPTLGQFRMLCKSRDASPSNARQLEYSPDPKKVEDAYLKAVFEMAQIKAGECNETKAESMKVLGMDKR